MRVIHWKCKHVTCNHVKFAKIVLVTPTFAQHGRNFAQTVLLSRDAAENHAIFAETPLDYDNTDEDDNAINCERISNNNLLNYTPYVYGNSAIAFLI